MNTYINIREASNGYVVEIQRAVNPLNVIAFTLDEVRKIVNEEVFGVMVLA